MAQHFGAASCHSPGEQRECPDGGQGSSTLRRKLRSGLTSNPVHTSSVRQDAFAHHFYQWLITFISGDANCALLGPS